MLWRAGSGEEGGRGGGGGGEGKERVGKGATCGVDRKL